ncbi:hypothetical protein [Pseudonocardia alni]|uniref:hypothetical protein n=1 Tax=Pseudonocardia alni TaxID=33907 RepID=UPI00280B60A4|nr:hypothetical protein [Pseudonocardia alni]
MKNIIRNSVLGIAVLAAVGGLLALAAPPARAAMSGCNGNVCVQAWDYGQGRFMFRGVSNSDSPYWGHIDVLTPGGRSNAGSLGGPRDADSYGPQSFTHWNAWQYGTRVCAEAWRKTAQGGYVSDGLACVTP